MDYKDYYKTLGVAKGASQKEIKAAYRRLARKFHPDMNPGDKKAEARFKEINEANEVLSDQDKRRKYDELGSNWAAYERGAPRGRPGGGRVRVDMSGFGGQGVSGFSDFFETFFGGAQGVGAQGRFDLEDLLRSRQGASRAAVGDDVEYEVELTLEEALRGATRTVPSRDGSSRRVEVKIPAGIRDGSRVRVAGEGDAGHGGAPRGDLYLRVRILPHDSFSRQGDDLQTTVAVPLTMAVLGGEVQVPTLDGPVGIKIPAGTPAGRVFRLRGHGMPRLEPGGGRGDLMAQLNVTLPENLSKREKELFEELRGLGR